MTSYLFSGGRFLDPRKDELQDGISVLVEDGTGEGGLRSADRQRFRHRASTCVAAR